MRSAQRPSVGWRLFLLPAVIVGLVAVAGCDKGQSVPPQPSPLPEVALFSVKGQEVLLTPELPGRTAAYRMVKTRPQINEFIQRCFFIED